MMSIFYILFLLAQVFGTIENLFGSIGIKPKISTGTAVPICPCSENKLQNLLNDLFNSTVVVNPPPPKQISVCENSQIIAKCLKEPFQDGGSCDDCDYSYIVLIKTYRNGCLTTVCQGLFLPDCTIATIYECTQLGEGLWVEFQNGKTFEVECIKEAKNVLSDNLLGTVFVVQLVIAADNCENLSNSFPKFSTYSPFLITNGSLISRHDCSSTCDISWSPVPSILVDATLKLGNSASVEVKVAIPDDVKRICQPYYAGTPFLDQYCNICGMAFRRPMLAIGALFTLPLANRIDTTCAITIAQWPSFDDCN